MIGALALVAWAAAEPVAPPADPVVDAVVAEMDAAVAELTLPEAPGLYHLRVLLRRERSQQATASFGALVSFADQPSVVASVEARVGTPALDNGNFGGWRTGFVADRWPAFATPEAARLAVWRLTDGAYKDAVEQLSRKEAQQVRTADHPGDYTLTGPVVADDGTAQGVAGVDIAGLTQVATRPLLRHPQLSRAEAHAGLETGELWILDTEGTRVRRPVSEVTLRVYAHAVADDGGLVTDQRLWTARAGGVAGWPSRAEIEGASRDMADDLLEIVAAPTLDAPYVGPVVFGDEAAAQLFRWLLAPQLQGTPPEAAFDTWLGGIDDGGGDGVRLKRRVLPPGWTVVDDPTAHPEHPGGWRHDAEGTAAQRVVAVEDGIVQRVLTTRVPRRDQPGSTGHGAARLGDRAWAVPTHLSVTPARARSERALLKRAWQVAASYGLDHVLVVERLQDPAVAGVGDVDRAIALGEMPLPPPVAVVRAYPDGRREIVRGARFAAVDRRLLRDVLLAGPVSEHDVLWSSRPDQGAFSPIGGLPGTVRAPAVLVGEVEVEPDPGDPARARRLPPLRATVEMEEGE